MDPQCLKKCSFRSNKSTMSAPYSCFAYPAMQKKGSAAWAQPLNNIQIVKLKKHTSELTLKIDNLKPRKNKKLSQQVPQIHEKS